MSLRVRAFNFGQDVDTGHKEPLPKIPIRALVLGPSGSGKSQLIMNWIFYGMVNYDSCTIIASSLDQKLYRGLMSMTKENKAYSWVNGIDAMPEVDSYKNCKNVVVLDDLMTEDQTKILDYFTRGTHKGLNMFYLAQGFTNIPRREIRNNVNLIVIFKQNTTDIEYIRDAYVGDIDKKKFREWVNFCTRNRFGYCVIDLTKTEAEGRFWSVDSEGKQLMTFFNS